MIVLVIFSCTKSQIKDTLKEHSRANQYTTVAILPINPRGKEFAKCLQKKLKDDLQYLKFFPGDKFREAMFPWFEPNTAPQNIEELSDLLAKPMVRKRIEGLGVELLIYVHGYIKVYDESYGADLIGAGGYAKRETDIQTTLWDLREIVRVGDTDISFKGTGFGAITIIPPFIIVIPDAKKSSACKETAKRISNCLTGKASSKDK
jgi:hypothetical protein